MTAKTKRFAFPKPSSAFVASMLSSHRALGVAMAGLVYILALSGVLSVFNHELQRWEQPGAPDVTAAEPETIQRAAQTLLAEEQTTHFYVQLPTWDLPRVVLTTDTQAVHMRADGTLAEPESHPWTQFVLDLHYYLTLPGTAGLTLVGMIGVLVFALTLSGLLSHPKIFRDAFRFRFHGQERLTQADIHNRLGVWTSPFVLSSALTGAMLGLAAVISGAIAFLDYEGDVEAVYAPVFGDEPAEIDTPAPLAEIGTALHYMDDAYPSAEPTYVLMHEPMTEGQHLQILAEHPERLIFGDYFNFSADGAYLGNVGMADGTAGQQIAASVYRLHFGSFGGMPIKFAYALFGSALAVMICAGMNIYFVRREQRRGNSQRLRSAWIGIVWGTPVALAICYPAAGLMPAVPLSLVFWGVLAVSVSGAVAQSEPATLARLGRLAAAASILALVASHTALNSDALGSSMVLPVGASLVALAGLLLVIGGTGLRRNDAAAVSQPAE